MSVLSKTVINRYVREALREDGAGQDATTLALIPKEHRSKAVIITKQKAVVCGTEFAASVFHQMSPACRVNVKVADARRASARQVVLEISGPTRAIISGERVALNFLSHLSAVATKTAEYVRLCKGTRAVILDTRKTWPGFRVAQRWAVACGGGQNHRFNLSDAVMIKDNHRVACADLESLAETVVRARQKTRKPIIVEVDTLKELKKVLPVKPDVILLDNMTPVQMKKAVALNHALKRVNRSLLEASGGITLKTIRRYAQTGVDRISLGDLTHSVSAIDFSLELEAI